MGLEDLLDVRVSSVDVTPTFTAGVRARLAGRRGSLKVDDELVRKLLESEESDEVKELYEADLNSKWGDAVKMAVESDGKKFKMPDSYRWLDLGKNALAATITLSDKSVVLAYNSRYAGKLKSNKPWNRLERLYVNMHEGMHVCGVHSESVTDALVAYAAKQYREKIIPGMKSYVDRFKQYVLEKVTRIIEETGQRRAAMQYGTS